MPRAVALVLIVALMAPACRQEAAGPSTTVIGPFTVAQNAESLRSVVMSGAEKLSMTTVPVGTATYAPPGTDATQVARVLYRADASLDLYYPPDYGFDAPLPAVVFINAFSATADTRLILPNGEPMETLPSVDFQNADSFTSLGNLVAASGMIAAVYGAGGDPVRDLADAMTWLFANADPIGIDPDHVAVWMFSAHTLTGLRAVMDDVQPWAERVSCAVVYYGWMPTDEIRTDFPVHVVKALHDDVWFNDSIEAFREAAAAAGAELDYHEVDGPHSFDFEPAYAAVASVAVERTLQFLTQHG